MRYYAPLLSLFVFLAACGGDATKMGSSNDGTSTQKADLTPPTAKKIAKEMTIHGDTRVDNYYWMNQRDSADVLEYLNAESDYADGVMKHTEKFQENLFEEMKARIKKTDESVPYMKNGYLYYTRNEEGKDYAISCRKAGGEEGKEEILLDRNIPAKGKSYYAASGLNVSPSNKLMAYGEDTVSRRIYTISFKNLETGEMLPDKIQNTTGSIAWANDNKTVFYMRKEPKTLRSYKIYKHILGTPAINDVEVYHEKDATFGTYVYRSKSGKYIFIYNYATLSTEVRYLDADKPNGKFKTFLSREKKHEYDVSHFGDKFYINTNWKAKNFRLMETTVGKNSKSNWKEVIPHREDVYLSNTTMFSNYLVVSERKEGITGLRIMPWDKSKEEYYVEMPEKAYLVRPSANPEFDTDILRYSYTSLTTPWSTYDFNMNDKSRELLKQQEVLDKKFDPKNYTSERIYATTADGVKVPISLVYKKTTKRDGSAPLYITGYGSYGSSSDPYFSSVRLSLLDRGFVFAIAHIRGGQEMGRSWYENGKLLKKKNTFTDFIACTEHLQNQKYTSADKTFAYGGSAGGLLMGAIANMKPEIYKGIIADVPFVDVVTTMLDESIPLTTGEYDEWGNPNEKEYYDYMKSYSPYDNIEAKDYPAMLIITGYHDSQVQYFEPAKWVAKLRELKTDKNPLIFSINMDAGHGGASGRFEGLKKVAEINTFMFEQLGMEVTAN